MLGSFTYQFQSPGTYYYYTPPVDSTGLITMRGVITVVAAQPRTLTAQASSNGYTGKLFVFLIFEYGHFHRSFLLDFSSILCFSIHLQLQHIYSMYNSE